MSQDFAYNHDTDRPVAVHYENDIIIVTLADGRMIGNPLAWHPWLQAATLEQRQNIELNAFDVWWPDLDEGLDIEGMLRDQTNKHIGSVSENRVTLLTT